MAKISNELKVAITVIASIIIAVLGFRVMRDNPLFRQAQLVYTHFERVDGLNTGNYVYINGVKVGSVKAISLAQNDSVRVSLGLDLDLSLPKGSVAHLESAGLLNDKAIVIERGVSGEQVPYGGTIRGVYDGGVMESLRKEGEKLTGSVSSSFGKLDTLLQQFTQVTNQRNREHIEETLGGLASTSREISRLMENKRTELEEGISHLNAILANVDTLSNRNKMRIDTALTRMNRSLNEIESLSASMSETSAQLNIMLKKINGGEGSLGMMVNDPSLYNNLDSLSAELKNLVRNINENPRKYLKNMRLIEIF